MSDDFDPDAFLASKKKRPVAQPAADFDPDAFVAAKAPPKDVLPRRTRNEAFWNGLANTFGTGDLIGAGAQTLGMGAMNLGDLARGRMSLGDFNRENLNTFKSAYRGNQRETKADREQQLGYSLGGSLVGGIASGPAFGARGLAGLLALNGGLGTIGGAAGSESDTWTGRAWDAGKGALFGLGGALAGHGLGKASPVVMRRLRQAFQESAVDKARKVLTAGADSLSTRKPVSAEAVQEALNSGAIRPLGTTKGAFERLERSAEDTGAVYGSIIDELEKRGVQGPEVEKVADSMLWRALQEHLESGADKATRNVFINEAQNLGRVAQGSPRLALTQAEQIKRTLQKAAKFGRYEDTMKNEARKEVSSILRQANEDAIEEAGEQMGGEVADIADTFKPVKQRLGRLLEARAAAERGNARTAQRTGGAAGISTFELANATTATGGAGLPALLLAAAQRLAKERGPSTLAVGYNMSSRGARSLADLLQRSPNRALYGAGLGRALGDDLNLLFSGSSETDPRRR